MNGPSDYQTAQAPRSRRRGVFPIVGDRITTTSCANMGRMTGWGSGGGCSMLVVAAMALLAGCGSGGGITDDPTLATLTHDDVAGIPPGTAIGTAFGGVYASVTESIVR